ncbi:single-stranded DNA-binding protein [Allonocardiopsis opalescens]|uniref:Single-strand DNA-binding protein n=1 Tax=Allonocardiopsis opalescens TaxID=1144618 RepID=A0A2T0PXW7_9ACTN|nr:single-stranded DNA-binding protein [Allonocardiopsis opalescens]PRX96246.1 single-strand DNA-binding protein [Allonocardiopsis opalescens]
MNAPHMTIRGTVVAEPRHRVLADGTQVLTLRLVSTHRYFDRAAGEWRKTEPMHIAVTCWRRLAENVAASVGPGTPLVVVGRLRATRWETEQGRRESVELSATSVGHDLVFGVARFQRSALAGADERTEAEAGAGGGSAPGPAGASGEPDGSRTHGPDPVGPGEGDESGSASPYTWAA